MEQAMKQMGMPAGGIQEWMKQMPEFPGAPTDICGHSTSIQVQMCGGKATKTVTRTYNLTSGGTKVVTVTEERTF